MEDIGNRRDRKTQFYDAEGTAIIPNFDSELKQYKLCASVFNTTIVSFYDSEGKASPKTKRVQIVYEVPQ